MRKTITLLTAALLGLALSGQALAAKHVITASDGVESHLTDFGQGEKGVLLVHGEGGSCAEWTAIAEKMQVAGFHVAAIDLRGHGEGRATLTEEDYPKMIADVVAGAEWLRAAGATEISVVGAGLGANLALNAAVVDSAGVSRLVLISPRPNIHGVKVLSAAASFPGEALMISSTQQALEVRTVDALAQKFTGKKHTYTVEANSSGVALIEREPAVLGLVMSWAGGTFNVATVEDQGLQTNVNTGDVTGVQTTGKKFGEE
ncbi:MAG: alpha/beta fold hydrolase [Deltaproteobacteria bacterium]|nr:alpha/beta fold hydrolase [Deltaproteobacteria bacterium]